MAEKLTAEELTDKYGIWRWRPLQEDMKHMVLLQQKQKEAQEQLISALESERASRKPLEMRLKLALQAAQYERDKATRSLVTAQQCKDLDTIARTLREENDKLKAEIKELKDKASIDARTFETKCAAWERGAVEATRRAEAEQDAARELARQANQRAEDEKEALKVAAKRTVDELKRAHADQIAALHRELDSVRNECSEQMSLTDLVHNEQVTELQEHIIELRNQLSSANASVATHAANVTMMKAKLEEAQCRFGAEKMRLQQVNRDLMIQLQTLKEGPRFQTASSLLAMKKNAPSAYPQLSVARQRLGQVGHAPYTPEPSQAFNPPPSHYHRPAEQETVIPRVRRPLFEDDSAMLPPQPPHQTYIPQLRESVRATAPARGRGKFRFRDKLTPFRYHPPRQASQMPTPLPEPQKPPEEEDYAPSLVDDLRGWEDFISMDNPSKEFTPKGGEAAGREGPAETPRDEVSTDTSDGNAFHSRDSVISQEGGALEQAKKNTSAEKSSLLDAVQPVQQSVMGTRTGMPKTKTLIPPIEKLVPKATHTVVPKDPQTITGRPERKDPSSSAVSSERQPSEKMPRSSSVNKLQCDTHVESVSETLPTNRSPERAKGTPKGITKSKILNPPSEKLVPNSTHAVVPKDPQETGKPVRKDPSSAAVTSERQLSEAVTGSSSVKLQWDTDVESLTKTSSTSRDKWRERLASFRRPSREVPQTSPPLPEPEKPQQEEDYISSLVDDLCDLEEFGSIDGDTAEYTTKEGEAADGVGSAETPRDEVCTNTFDMNAFQSRNSAISQEGGALEQAKRPISAEKHSLLDAVKAVQQSVMRTQTGMPKTKTLIPSIQELVPKATHTVVPKDPKTITGRPERKDPSSSAVSSEKQLSEEMPRSSSVKLQCNTHVESVSKTLSTYCSPERAKAQLEQDKPPLDQISKENGDDLGSASGPSYGTSSSLSPPKAINHPLSSTTIDIPAIVVQEILPKGNVSSPTEREECEAALKPPTMLGSIPALSEPVLFTTKVTVSGPQQAVASSATMHREASEGGSTALTSPQSSGTIARTAKYHEPASNPIPPLQEVQPERRPMLETQTERPSDSASAVSPDEQNVCEALAVETERSAILEAQIGDITHQSLSLQKGAKDSQETAHEQKITEDCEFQSEKCKNKFEQPLNPQGEQIRVSERDHSDGQKYAPPCDNSHQETNQSVVERGSQVCAFTARAECPPEATSLSVYNENLSGKCDQKSEVRSKETAKIQDVPVQRFKSPPVLKQTAKEIAPSLPSVDGLAESKHSEQNKAHVLYPLAELCSQKSPSVDITSADSGKSPSGSPVSSVLGSAKSALPHLTEAPSAVAMDVGCSPSQQDSSADAEKEQHGDANMPSNTSQAPSTTAQSDKQTEQLARNNTEETMPGLPGEKLPCEEGWIKQTDQSSALPTTPVAQPADTRLLCDGSPGSFCHQMTAGVTKSSAKRHHSSNSPLDSRRSVRRRLELVRSPPDARTVGCAPVVIDLTPDCDHSNITHQMDQAEAQQKSPQGLTQLVAEEPDTDKEDRAALEISKPPKEDSPRREQQQPDDAGGPTGISEVPTGLLQLMMSYKEEDIPSGQVQTPEIEFVGMTHDKSAKKLQVHTVLSSGAAAMGGHRVLVPGSSKTVGCSTETSSKNRGRVLPKHFGLIPDESEKDQEAAPSNDAHGKRRGRRRRLFSLLENFP